MLALRPARLAGLALVLTGLAGSGLLAAGSTGGSPAPPDRAASAVLAAGQEQLGDAYEWAGAGPDTWDCSGLTSTLWRTVGGVSTIPRTSRQQQAWATSIRAEDALPGDLVFFGNPVHHVSLYLGDGRILDASSSRKAVVERAVWTSDVVRYGRVPRPTAPKSRPVEPTPAGSASAQPTAAATPTPAAAGSRPSPSASPTASVSQASRPATSAAPRAAMTPTPAPSRPVPAPGHRPKAKPGRTAAAFVSAAQSATGAGFEAGRSGPTYDAAGLVRMAWWKATSRVLPADLAAIERRTKPVALADLALGDLIFYGTPAVHVGVYVGNGDMVDASKVLKKVSRRQVFSSDTVRFARITG